MSASSGFGTYKTAKTVVDAVSKKAAADVARDNPAPKTAIVTEINMAERWCMVIYTGEITAVKIPFSDAAPSYTGQHVVIGGSVSDRHITEVIGKTYSEDAVDELSPCLAEIYTDVSKVNAINVPVKLNLQSVPPLGCTVDANGVITTNVNGIFQFLLQVHGNSTGAGTYYLRIVKITPEGVVTVLGSKQYDMRISISGGGGEGGTNARGSIYQTRVMVVNVLGSLVAGDKVQAEGMLANGMTPEGVVTWNGTPWGPKSSLRIHKIGPFEEAAAIPDIPDPGDV